MPPSVLIPSQSGQRFKPATHHTPRDLIVRARAALAERHAAIRAEANRRYQRRRTRRALLIGALLLALLSTLLSWGYL